MSFKTTRGDKYRGAHSVSKETRIMNKLRRDWNRHPEIRAEHGGSFKRYITSVKHNVTFL